MQVVGEGACGCGVDLGRYERSIHGRILTWEKTDTIWYDGHPYLAIDKCANFERGLWFELGNSMWRKHRSVYQDHMNYVRNDTLKPFKIKILRYA